MKFIIKPIAEVQALIGARIRCYHLKAEVTSESAYVGGKTWIKVILDVAI